MNQSSGGGSARSSPSSAARSHNATRPSSALRGGLRPDDYPQNTQAPIPPIFQHLPPPYAAGAGMPMYPNHPPFPPYDRDPQAMMSGGPGSGPGGPYSGSGSYLPGGAGAGPPLRSAQIEESAAARIRRESMPDLPSYGGQQQQLQGRGGGGGGQGPMGMSMLNPLSSYPDMRMPMMYPTPPPPQAGLPGSRPGSSQGMPSMSPFGAWHHPFGGGGHGVSDLPRLAQLHDPQGSRPSGMPSAGASGSAASKGKGADDDMDRRMSGPQSSDIDPMSRPNSPGRPMAMTGISTTGGAGDNTKGRYPDGDSDGEGLVPKSEHVDHDEEKLDHRKRKRNRTIRSCVPCHNHKRKEEAMRPVHCAGIGKSRRHFPHIPPWKLTIQTGTCVYEVDEARDPNDPDEIETDRLRRRVAELEQVVRELRQRNQTRQGGGPSTTGGATSTSDSSGGGGGAAGDSAGGGHNNSKRRVIVDRFARFKIDEAAAAAAEAGEGVDDSSPEAGGAANGGERRAGESSTYGEPGQNIPEDSPSGGAYGAMSTPTQSDHPDMGKKDYKFEPYRTHLLPGEEMVYDRSGRKTFLGAPAGKSMMRRLRELMSQKSKGTGMGGDEDLLSVPEDVAFMGQFPDMRKTFPFTTIWSHENFSGEIIGLLPNQEQAEVLLEAFRTDIMPFFLAWHVPTLEAEYRRFFEMSTIDKMNVPLSALALYLMICSLGCVIRASKAEIFGQNGVMVEDPTNTAQPSAMISRDPKDLTSSRLQSELYLSAAYQALRLCSFLSNPTIYTIQAQILVNVYLLNSERAADAWSQTGSLIRQCIAMGLHVDPAILDPRISLRDAEIRRRVWWTVAGLDALFCVSFGRPSAINFYTTNLPQDRTDNNLPEVSGSAQAPLPPSNVLRNETTDSTYHSAYFQLTIPSYELLDRIFHTEWTYSRSAIYGWFSRTHDSGGVGGAYASDAGGLQAGPRPPDDGAATGGGRNTYEGSIRLAKDVVEWYAHLPDGMRFEPDSTTTEAFVRSRSPIRVNQTLVLCVKTFMIILCLQRPYLRLDPSAYPESTEICFNAAHAILKAYSIASQAHSSVFWTWWTMTFRAFHAAAVVAFLSIRQPGTDLALRCLADLEDAVSVFKDRIATWNIAHPVQADLLNGLCRLERLAKAAAKRYGEQQYGSSSSESRNSATAQPSRPQTGPIPTIVEPPPASNPASPVDFGARTPLSQIKAFPNMSSTSPAAMAQVYNSGIPGTMNRPVSQGDLLGIYGIPQSDALGFQGDGFSGNESFALPAMWASMFGIKLDGVETGSAGMM